MGEILLVHEMRLHIAATYNCPADEAAATLLASYVLSGCDGTSYLFMRGKKTAAAKALHMVGKLPALAQFGGIQNHENLVEQNVVQDAKTYLISLYMQMSIDSFIDLREQQGAWKW